MGIRRTLVAFASIAAVAAVSVAPASAAAPPFKTQYAPVSAQITKIGNDIGTAVTTANGKTDAQLALTFANLATRTAKTAVTLSKLPGASGRMLITQQQLALALTKGASDLLKIATAAQHHDAAAAKAATILLVKDSAPIKSTHKSLSSSLGLAA